jgi:UDP-N-acetylmuramate dehydrogenase
MSCLNKESLCMCLEFMNIQKNILLAEHTTFRIGGPAKYFFIVKTIPDLMKAVKFVQTKKLPYFILGGGSNLLVGDKGFDGVVIKIRNTKYELRNTRIMAEAGTRLNDLVKASAEAGLTGLEFAAGIPGTIGGAIYGNAGSQKGSSSIGDLVETITLLTPTGQVITVDKAWMQFDYRHSRFKDMEAAIRPIILSVVLKLARGNSKKIKQKINKQIAGRVNNIPIEPSAGCVFKNPSNQSAGYLIERCGLKGKKIGGAMVSKQHANFIINLGGAKARDVIELINLIKKSVQKKFGIKLAEEIGYLSK